MINPSIVRLLLNKSEQDAAVLLAKFKCKWRVMCRDGKNEKDLSNDRDDNRYNLVLSSGKVERVLPG